MRDRIDAPKEGDPLSAAWAQQVSDVLGRETQGGGAQDVSPGAVYHQRIRGRRLGVFKLTSDFSADSLTSSSGAPTHDWPHATAQPVYYFDYDREWSTGPAADHSVMIWHPTGYESSLRSDMVDYGVYCGVRGLGDFVIAAFDPQGECWEMVEGFSDVLRVELKTDLTEGGSADCYLLLSSGLGTDFTFSASDGIDAFAGTGRDNVDTGAGEHGDRGYVRFFADSGWEFIQLSCQDFTATSSSSGV